MGYKCPNCHKDFGFDKDKLEEHFLENPECGVEAYVIRDILPISLGIKKAKHPYGKRGLVEHEKRKIEQMSPNHNWVKVNVVTNEDGSDDVVCTRCGLKAKRYMSELKFDMRFTRKIQHCID